MFLASIVTVGFTQTNLNPRSDRFRSCVIDDLPVCHRFLLQALVMICATIVLLVPIPSYSLDVIADRFPLFLALVGTTAIALADFHANDRPGERMPGEISSAESEPETFQGRTSFLPPADYDELRFLYMEGGGTQTASRTSTHTSSVSLSQTALSKPRPSWDFPTRRLLEQRTGPDRASADPCPGRGTECL